MYKKFKGLLYFSMEIWLNLLYTKWGNIFAPKNIFGFNKVAVD
jgi:hypothetical protein